MKKNLWIFCLLVFLPGCLSQTHYNKLMGMSNDTKAIKEHNKKQDQRIDRMEKTLHQLQSSLHSVIRDSGVRVEPVKTSHVIRSKTVADGTIRIVHETPVTNTVRIVQAIDAIKVTIPQAILFASGSTRINHAGESVLTIVAEELKNVSGKGLIRIVGHSDSRPIGARLRSHFTDNWELSAARAAAVARVFTLGEHISAKHIRVEGRASMDPVANDATLAGRAKNRRIEIFLEKIG